MQIKKSGLLSSIKTEYIKLAEDFASKKTVKQYYHLRMRTE